MRLFAIAVLTGEGHAHKQRNASATSRHGLRNELTRTKKEARPCGSRLSQITEKIGLLVAAGAATAHCSAAGMSATAG